MKKGLLYFVTSILFLLFLFAKGDVKTASNLLNGGKGISSFTSKSPSGFLITENHPANAPLATLLTVDSEDVDITGPLLQMVFAALCFIVAFSLFYQYGLFRQAIIFPGGQFFYPLRLNILYRLLRI